MKWVQEKISMSTLSENVYFTEFITNVFQNLWTIIQRTSMVSTDPATVNVLYKGVLRNFVKFTGKHLCQSLFLSKVAGFRQTRHFQANASARKICSRILESIQISGNIHTK